jgi:molecular chaperone HtpG
VDDFWVNIAHEYKGKKFKSVSRSDIELDKNEKKEDTAEDDIIALFKTTLGDKVKDVKYSNRLTESPVCLAIAEGDMDFRMERFMRENRQIPHESLRILEVNKSHSLIKNIRAGNANSADVINLLFDQALILEGEKLPDPKNFANLINKLLAKNLAA